MIERLKYAIARILYRWKLRGRLEKDVRNDYRRRVLLLNVPSHGNLGDHLIAVAEKQLIKDMTGEEPRTFTTADLYYGIDLIEKEVCPEDVVLITGGGYLGSIWPEEEARVTKLVKDLPGNTIIVMPQTVYYDEDEDSVKLLNASKKIYHGHPNFHLTVREIVSRKVCVKELGLGAEDVELLPDMALYLNFSDSIKPRKGILFCLRDDKEKLHDPKIAEVLKAVEDEYEVRYTDTQAGRAVSQEEELEEVKALVAKFQSAELVITDRLHGMLYSTICGTPVIALDNYSHKVKNVYDCWLKDLRYVRFTDNARDLSKHIDELLQNGPQKYHPEVYQNKLQSYFKVKLDK